MHISYIAIAISIIYKLKYAVIKNADKIEKSHNINKNAFKISTKIKQQCA